MQVPDEVVQQSEFERGNRGEEIMSAQQMVEERERAELNTHTDDADEIKFEPVAECCIHGSGSSR
jgi:hypothetical protein